MTSKILILLICFIELFSKRQILGISYILGLCVLFPKCRESCLTLEPSFGPLLKADCVPKSKIVGKCVCNFAGNFTTTTNTIPTTTTAPLTTSTSTAETTSTTTTIPVTTKEPATSTVVITTTIADTSTLAVFTQPVTVGPSLSKQSGATVQQFRNSAAFSAASSTILRNPQTQMFKSTTNKLLYDIPPIQNDLAIIIGCASAFVGCVIIGIILLKTIPVCQRPNQFVYVKT